MRLGRFSVNGESLEGSIEGGRVVTDAGEFELAVVETLPPCDPTKIVAVGKNYLEHVEEMSGSPMPEFPFLFFKPPSAVIGHEDAIVYPDGADVVHYEGELGVVIEDRCRHVSVDEAMEHVRGYTGLNDVSWRDWSGREDQWVRHKGVDTFCPIGPFIRTDPPEHVDVRTRLNDELRQSENTREMAFSVPELIAEASRYMTLEPGDVIATGTPAGVGELHPGDVVEVEIPEVGTLRNEVVSASG